MGQTFEAMGWNDRTIRVNKAELLEVLRTNRAQHEKDYIEACKGYRSQALVRIEEIFHDLKTKINGLREGQTVAVIGLTFDLEVPHSHVKAYDQIIRMMEMSVDDVIELTSSQFACFVQDDWDWKDDWHFSNSKYIGR